MHPNPIFRKQPQQRNLEFAAETGVGTLAVNGPDGLPLMAHVPLIIEEGRVLFHLVRSNPVARILGDGVPGKFFIQGPGSYISPDWYGMEDQVPTWNYVAVHLAGPVTLLPQEQLRDVLERLSDRFEANLEPKPIWKLDKLADEPLARLMRQIVPCQMQIEDVQGTWKLGQNKPKAARLSAASEVAGHGIGHELDALAELMRNPPADE